MSSLQSIWITSSSASWSTVAPSKSTAAPFRIFDSDSLPGERHRCLLSGSVYLRPIPPRFSPPLPRKTGLNDRVSTMCWGLVDSGGCDATYCYTSFRSWAHNLQVTSRLPVASGGTPDGRRWPRRYRRLQAPLSAFATASAPTDLLLFPVPGG
ncbi:hypothetical protein FB45DRAFT_891520 [Roridomyces roridus]|uniref:Uncharacterized protein n=1 Tax=Roridomyces roridus TaxID=1738132 RepID=A0AAD7CEK4_9AGAR|nr:hypothetical protein FB45DRAFT_891520 [Roridomyces roridus]